MNLRSPAELYIKYLLVHPDKYPTLTIQKVLEELGIYYLGDDYIETLRRQMVIPEPFRPQDKMHPRSHRFIIAQNIRSLFLPTADTKLALKLMEAPRAREFIESMLLSHAPPGAIAMSVMRMGINCTPGAVNEFKKYFWNTELLTTTQFRVLLQMTLDQNVEDADNQFTRDKKRALKKASYLDPRKLAAELPHSPLTALMTQMRMGLMPNRLELAKILELGRAMAAVRVLEATIAGSPQDSGKALNFSIVAKNMAEVLETAVKPDEHLREELQAIALRTESAAVPSIHQLSEGRHTVDVLPTLLKEQHEPGLESKQDGGVDRGVSDRAE